MSLRAASDSSLPVSRTLYHPPFNPSPPSPRVLRLQCHAGSSLAETLIGAPWQSGCHLELPGHRAASEPLSGAAVRSLSPAKSKRPPGVRQQINLQECH